MDELKPGDELPYVPPTSIEEVLSSIRFTARQRNWTAQEVLAIFNAGLAARQILGMRDRPLGSATAVAPGLAPVRPCAMPGCPGLVDLTTIVDGEPQLRCGRDPRSSDCLYAPPSAA